VKCQTTGPVTTFRAKPSFLVRSFGAHKLRETTTDDGSNYDACISLFGSLIIVISGGFSPCYSAFGTPEELGRCFIAPARLHHPIESFSMPAFLAASFYCRESSYVLLFFTDYHDGLLGLSGFLHHWIRASSFLPTLWAH